jgi:hypothetical protein
MFKLGMGTLAALLILRVFLGRSAVTGDLFWLMSFGWPFLVCSAIASGKGASMSQASPWSALVIITTLMAGFLTMVVMGLPLEGMQIDPFLIGFFALVLAVVCVGWWRLLRPAKAQPSQDVARRWLWVVFGLVTATCILIDKLGLMAT